MVGLPWESSKNRRAYGRLRWQTPVARSHVGGTGWRGMSEQACPRHCSNSMWSERCNVCLTPPASGILEFGTSIQGGYMHSRCVFGAFQPDMTGMLEKKGKSLVWAASAMNIGGPRY